MNSDPVSFLSGLKLGGCQSGSKGAVPGSPPGEEPDPEPPGIIEACSGIH